MVIITMVDFDTRETFKAEIINSGRITIPKTIRTLHNLQDGDIIEVVFERKIKSRSLDGTPGSLHEAQDPLLDSVGAPVSPKGGP